MLNDRVAEQSIACAACARRKRRRGAAALLLASLFVLAGCGGTITASEAIGPDGTSGGPRAGRGGTPSASGELPGGNDGDPSNPNAPSQPGTATPTDNIAARVIRLSVDEYEASVHDLFPNAGPIAQSFIDGGDSRQAGYTRADVFVVGELLAQDIQKAADGLAANAVKDLATLLPCDPASKGEDECAKQFIASFGEKAYRRPLTEDEKTALFGLFSASREAQDFSAGIEDVISGVLQSAGFLYRTEIGDGKPDGDVVHLTNDEIASQLSYLVIGGPPDATLRDLAAKGMLMDASVREAQVQRLISSPQAHAQLVRFLSEWTGIDRLSSAQKDANVYPGFDDAAKARLKTSAEQFMEKALFQGQPSLGGLLTTPDAGDAKRVGLLAQAAFLATRANEYQSSPVKRGVFIRRQVLCEDLPPPPKDLKIVVPKADPKQTTRERFENHSMSSTCAGCHDRIDELGFAFENFDGVGAYRTMENGKPIDASGELTSESKQTDGMFTDAAGLVTRLAQSEQAQACLRREFFRFMSMQSGELTEERFLAQASEDDLIKTLTAFARSEMFVTRGVQ